MNIAVLHFHRLGGSGIIAYELARAMLQKGHRIHFVGLNPPFRMHDDDLGRFYFHRVTFEPYPVFDFQPYSFALASQLSELITEHQIDVIHSHYAIPFAVVALLAKQISGRKVKCITTLHGTDITVVGSDPSMFHITKYSIEHSDHVTCVSHYLKDKTNDLFGFKEDKIKMIYNFIDLKNIPKKAAFQPLSRKDEIVLLHSSNLREVKSPQEVITIFDLLIKKVDPGVAKRLRLWILGDGPLKASMIRMVRRLELCDQVTFWGEKPEISRFIRQADFFLFPSREESFGLAALEAMAWGVPVIAKEVGGLSELINHSKDGILFPTKKIDFAVEMIHRLIDDEQGYRAMVEQARLKVENCFSMDQILPQFEQLYWN